MSLKKLVTLRHYYSIREPDLEPEVSNWGFGIGNSSEDVIFPICLGDLDAFHHSQ